LVEGFGIAVIITVDKDLKTVIELRERRIKTGVEKLGC
jgi:hydroxylamine reductase (hybrid-cluster protein)